MNKIKKEKMSDKIISRLDSILKPSGDFENYHWQINTWSKLHEGINFVRNAVFVEEQHISPENVFSDSDIQAVQMLVTTKKGRAFVGAAQLSKESVGVSRVAYFGVVYNHRGNHVGKLMLNQLSNFARRRRDRLLIAHVPTYAVVFFRKMGFEVFGEPFEAANIAHVKMQLIL